MSDESKSWKQKFRRALGSSSKSRHRPTPSISLPSNFQLNPGFPRVEWYPDTSRSRSRSPLPPNRSPNHFDYPNDVTFVRKIRLADGSEFAIPEPDRNAILFERNATPPQEDYDSILNFECTDEEERDLLEVDFNERFRYVAEDERPKWYRVEDGCPHMHQPGDTSYLCATCRRIDFSIIINMEETENIPPLIDFIVLGPFKTIIKKGKCGLCRLVLSIWKLPMLKSLAVDASEGETAELILTKLVEDAQDMYYLYPVRFKLEYSVPAWHLCKNIWNPDRGSMLLADFMTALPSRDLAIRPIMMPEPGGNVPGIPRFGRLIVPDRIDLDWIKERLLLCDERSVRGPMRYSGVLRAIDVHRLCIVELEDDQRYVTLSYVWGMVNQLQLTRDNARILYTPGGLSRYLPLMPKTIRDAMKLTELIGERFLWVDAICIIQEGDPEDKIRQIMKMGDIYQQSTLTIIACCGTDASYGLPGLVPGTRLVRQVMSIVGHIPMSNMLSNDDIMVSSYWSTRAWTMQEKMLSRRKLIITDHVVLWWCWHSSNPEDEHDAHHYWPRGERDQDMVYFNTENDRVVKKRGALSSFDFYTWLLLDYTKRKLSVQSDAANAFQGAFKALSDRMHCTFIQGLPDTELEDALLWCPIGSSVRRTHEQTGQPLFSSWSWLGWRGIAAYPGHSERDFPTSSVNSPLLWYSATSEASFTGQDYRAWDSYEHALNETKLQEDWNRDEKDEWCWNSTNGRINSTMPFHHPVNRSRLRPFRFLQSEDDDNDVRGSGLAFRTLSTRFTLSESILRRKENFDYEHKVFQQQILDASGYSVGYIYTPDTNTFSPNQRAMFSGIKEFVVISRASINPSPLIGTEFLYRDIFQSSLSLTMPVDARKGLRLPHDGKFVDEKAFFDNRIYYKTNPWCLFNVLMIVRGRDESAYRVAMGRIHVGAFMTSGPTWRDIKMY